MLLTLAARVWGAEPCSLHRLGELPVTMEDLVPTVHAKINGTDARFVADSGAFFSLISPAAAEQLHLSLGYSPITIVGIGGEAQTRMTTVKTFTIFDVDIPKVPFLVAGNDLGSGIVGLLGQNVFRLGDVVEYDLANGVIRILRTKGDCSKANLAYWANAKQQPYSVIEMEFATSDDPHTRSVVYVNGERTRALFDTGSSFSVLSPAAARRAGVTPKTPGVTPGGQWGGVGTHLTQTFIAPFNSFKIGDEDVQHTKLRIGDVGNQAFSRDTDDMLIGADFFLSHHVLVATGQRRLYFTYNSGPVFNLTDVQAAAAGGSATATAGAAASLEHLDAAAYARRGAAETSRHDYEHAIADLTRACELAPTEADYFYERGMAYWHTKQGDPALADFDSAIKIKPDDVSALIARATLYTQRGEADDKILADLDAADRAAPREDAARVELGQLYREAGKPDAAIVQFTKFIDSHNRDEVEVAEALDARCWTRALAGRELEQALDDCDRAVRRRRTDGSAYDSRGLVHLRLGHYDKAIDDYDAALRLNPKFAWSLYGRGIAKLRKGQTAAGQADIDAATKMNADIAERAARYGITP